MNSYNNSSYNNSSSSRRNTWILFGLTTLSLIAIVVAILVLFVGKKATKPKDIVNKPVDEGIPEFSKIVNNYIANYLITHQIHSDCAMNDMASSTFVNAIVNGNDGVDRLGRADDAYKFDGIGYKRGVMAFQDIFDSVGHSPNMNKETEAVYNYLITTIIMKMCLTKFSE